MTLRQSVPPQHALGGEVTRCPRLLLPQVRHRMTVMNEEPTSPAKPMSRKISNLRRRREVNALQLNETCKYTTLHQYDNTCACHTDEAGCGCFAYKVFIANFRNKLPPSATCSMFLFFYSVVLLNSENLHV